MRKLRRVLYFCLALCLVAGLFVGAGSTKAQAADTINLTMAHHHAVGSLTDDYCNDFAKLVSEKTDGKVVVTVYPGAQLGTEQEVADGLLMGTQQLGAITAGGCYVDTVPGFGVETLPFMAADWDELWYIFNESGVGDALNERLIDKGARILGWCPFGGRHMIFVSKNVTSYKEIAGLNMRCPESTLYTEMFRALGASPTPITWSDCYTALQTKVVDGMETPMSSMVDMNFAEVSKYCLMTNHMWTCFTLAVNEALFESLPEEYQNALVEAGKEATVNCYAKQRDAETAAIAACEEKGITFNHLSEEEQEELPGIFDQMKADWLTKVDGRQEIYDLFQQAREDFAAQKAA